MAAVGGVALTWFEALCRQRHEAGVREHRGGDANAPFAGDPLQERINEHADSANYLIEAAQMEGLGPDPGAWPVGWLAEWNRNADSANWTRRRMIERDRRGDGGIRWECGDLDEAGRG